MLAIVAATTPNWGPQFVGEIVLLTVAAVVLGFGTFKLLPATMSPKFFGVTLPFLLLGSLAYMGSWTAATAVVIFVGLAVVALALGMA
jgi:hypothetical protein